MPLDPDSANIVANTAAHREPSGTTSQYPPGLPSSMDRRDKPAPRLIPMATLTPNEPASPPPPSEEPAFHAFLTLPPELRLVIYSHYFTFPDHLIAPKSHPRTRHATALLYVSRQVHEEALPVFYAETTLTINLHPRYHEGVRDYAWWLDHYVRPGGNFRGHVCAVGKFAHVRIVLDEMAPPQEQGQGVSGPEDDGTATALIDASNWWQHIAPLFWSTLAYCTLIHIPDLTLELQLGDIFTAPPYPVSPPTNGPTPPGPPTTTAPTAMPGPAANPPRTSTSFATYATHPYWTVHGWNSSNAQRPSKTTRATGANFLRTGWRGVREAVCLMQIVFWMGRMGEGSEGVVVQAAGQERKFAGEGLRVKVGNEERKVEGDKLPALVKAVEEMMQEKEMHGEGEGGKEDGEGNANKEGDVWLVVRMKGKKDAEKGLAKMVRVE